MRGFEFCSAVIVLALANVASSQNRVVCYFGGWSVYRPGDGKFDISDIDPTLCTHMIYTFVGITENGDIKVLDEWQDLPDNGGKDGFGRFNALRQKSPSTKTLIAIGGWNEGSARYSTVAASPALRERFANNAVAFVEKYKFDGFDIDWEYPNQRGGRPEDVKNFVELLKVMKDKFSKKGLLLTAAVASAEPSASQSYNIAEINKYLDFINIMTYDLKGSWEKETGLHSALETRASYSGNDRKLNVRAAVEYWLKSGVSSNKLVLGIPFYARTFTLADRNKNGVGAPTTGPGTAGPYTREGGMLGYNEICVNLREGGWTVVRDPEQRVPFAFKDNQWMGYDDVTSINEKIKFIRDKKLGGAMLWSIETDDFRGKCGEKYPLLKTLKTGLSARSKRSIAGRRRK